MVGVETKPKFGGRDWGDEAAVRLVGSPNAAYNEYEKSKLFRNRILNISTTVVSAFKIQDFAAKHGDSTSTSRTFFSSASTSRTHSCFKENLHAHDAA